MRLTCIDFETATAARDSACALGLVVLEGRRVAERRSWLIRPPGNAYSRFNIAIHHITPAMTAGSPEFAAVWPEVRPYLAGGVAAAHNAPFDIGVLRACLGRCGLDAPDMRYYCTLSLSRAVLPRAPSHKLDRLCAAFGIAFRHHDATEDAWAAGQLLVKLLERTGARDVVELAAECGICAGAVDLRGCSPCRRTGGGRGFAAP